MPLIVQDDNGSVAGANGYLSVADFKSYHDDRANSYATYADADIEAAIVRATDYLDTRFNFAGERNQGRTQTTEWPRHSARDRDGYFINGIPEEVKEATAEYALRALAASLNPDPTRDDSGQRIKSKAETVGPIESSVTFADGVAFELPRYPAADNKLRRAGLVRSGGQLIRG